MTEQKTVSGSEPRHDSFYTVDIEQFEGPLDLLLSLVKKNEINIYDIPIAEVSEQYNKQLEIMRRGDFDSVAQYLPLLAELGLLKSRMLLPKTEEDEQEDGIDPRLELARRLVVYERFRDAAARMGEMSLLGRDVFAKGLGYSEEFGEPEIETEVAASGVWPLIVALCEMRARINEGDAEEIYFTIDPVSVEQRISEIHEKIREKGVIEDFNMLFDEKPSRSHIAISFIAVLELARKEVVELFQKKPFSAIKLLYSEGEKDGKESDKENN
ncbi:segregation and condensation protein A [Candidatus Mycalebacterium sp.]